MSSEQWFIDETKVSGLTFAVVAAKSFDLGGCRTLLERLVASPRHKSSGLHFHRESDATRSAAFRLIASMPISVVLLTVPPGVKAVPARERAVRSVARRALTQRPVRIIFELDEAALVNDRRWLREEFGSRPAVEYQHFTKNSDPMLWVADGIAWAVQRGGRWRKMIDHLVTETVEV